MLDRSRLGLVLTVPFSLLFFFVVFCLVEWDIGDVVSYSSTSMGISELEDNEYALEAETSLFLKSYP